MKLRTGLFFVKVCLLLFATVLLISSLIDILAFQPYNPSCGGACIEVSTTTITIQGVNFIGTVWGTLWASVLTVAALTIDVLQQFYDNLDKKTEEKFKTFQ